MQDISQITQEAFEQLMLDDKDNTVLVKFYLPTCGPCKVLDSVLTQVEDQYKVYTIDCSQNSDLMRAYKVKTVPTTIVFHDGENKGFFLGMRTKEFIENKVNELTSS